MTFVITQGCCDDASCIAVCPVQCIRPRPGDPDFTTAEQLYIDPATCIDCGACMDECPVSAIHSEWDLPEEFSDFLDINADYFATNPIEESSPPDPVRRTLPSSRPELSVAIVGTGPRVATPPQSSATSRASPCRCSTGCRRPSVWCGPGWLPTTRTPSRSPSASTACFPGRT